MAERQIKRRSQSFTSRVQRLLEQGRTVKEIAKILKCEPSKVSNAKWYINKTGGIAALPAKKPRESTPKQNHFAPSDSAPVSLMPVTSPPPNASPVPSPYEKQATSATWWVVGAAVSSVLIVLIGVFG